LLLGVFSIVQMPTDIFPNIDIPVVTVVWNYAGLSADQMSTRITFNVERGMTTAVSDIEHIESQSLNGVAVIKSFSAACEHWRRGGAGDGDQPGDAAQLPRARHRRSSSSTTPRAFRCCNWAERAGAE